MEKHSRYSHSGVWICRVSYPVPDFSRSSYLRRGVRNLHSLKTFWRGKIPLRDVKWTFSSNREHVLSNELEARREEIWTETLDKYPDTYDGQILVLDDFRLIEGAIELKLSLMRFSRILTLVKSKLPAPGYGLLGFQAIIFSLEKDYILAGIRSERSQYCPLFYSIPGGMLETSDLAGEFQNACMREINEETNVKLAPAKYMVALMPELHGTVGAVAVISGIAVGEYDIKGRVDGNDEWVNKELLWFGVDELKSCRRKNSLEGLLFVKQERARFMKTNSSVLWP